MRTFRPLRGVLCIYDVLRLILMIEVIFLFVSHSEGQAGFPILAYMAPNALFPLIAFFLWRRPEYGRPYLYLYSAGKIICIVANLGWLLFSYKNIIPDLPDSSGGIPTGVFPAGLITAGSALALVVLDGFSVLAALQIGRDKTGAVRVEGEIYADYSNSQR
jgi:hypothetical protein